MPKVYNVSIPITGRVEVEVSSEDEKEAIKKAVRKSSLDIDSYLAQVDFLENEASVFDEDDFKS